MTRSTGDAGQTPDLTGRRFLVTGANRGLGFFAAEQLVRAGAHVIVTGRNPNRLAAAHAAIERRARAAREQAAGPGPARIERWHRHAHAGDAAPRPRHAGSVETLLLDTGNLGSVRAAAATARVRGPLHGLLLNAGIVHPPAQRRMTGGHEMVFAANVLGHFVLAGELLQNLAVVGGRMVWLGSVSTVLGRYDPVDDPELVDGYTPWKAYVQSKVTTTALGLEADRRLRAAGVPVRSLVAHPGYALSGRTPGIRGVNEPTRLTRFFDNLQTPVSQSKQVAARVLVRALTDPDVAGGEYWGPRFWLHGPPHRGRAARLTRDPALAARLWEYCERAARTRWPFEKAARARGRR